MIFPKLTEIGKNGVRDRAKHHTGLTPDTRRVHAMSSKAALIDVVKRWAEPQADFLDGWEKIKSWLQLLKLFERAATEPKYRVQEHNNLFVLRELHVKALS
jgi:hypothetical protein